ncbi:16S rRNA (cytosine(1402)-N(4))-methyltransferase RsmH [Pontibacter sp. BT310]|uniref:Ribosomal RNA small subunit methyltransferase H n=1 Tax=Pontibacter populi TaxID=890055 RepID=A0ABS6XBN1_9BACT|nr:MULTISPECIES: 16S rRNA (cytosine(1402)-N(4))-methyltransferase RsmH [Pontibacter]MBJ6118544.1 16S rRNA (cytosine(1402)-N(4))-methyltransferase RsmH [Pontibacter sp. BT310]MBR0570973.1 16S rRNA (cytosine(1402)-N(4))-methyltransferase RsmH [Microvirga sp. STS03]MBW3365398.1 16S rRNA (cytosine(1402)-N(4))-methyltransferase RsmH [Pontibacter populi]
MEYHRPVMLEESVDALAIKPDGVYVDVTFGGGGHSALIVSRLTTGKLYSFDQDRDAEEQSKKLEGPNFQFVRANFRDLKKYLRLHRVKEVDGILADLGVSSHQFNEGSRGFSTRFDGPLDMRMDYDQGNSAKEVVENYSEEQLHRIFGIYGEVKNAKTLARTIVEQRARKPIETIEDFKQAIRSCTPKGKENKYLAQVFQALRIEVNDEMKALEEMLVQAAEVLKPGGRLAVISYHSLEDRLVKNFIAKGKFFGEVEKDLFGNEIKPLDAVSRKPVVPTEEELLINSRSRSAKLRIAAKRDLDD